VLALLTGILVAVPATAAQAATPDPARRQIIDLGTLGGQFTLSEARAVNDRGQVVGDSIAAGLGPEHAFLWANGRMRDLGLAAYATANDLNDRGQVTGGYPLPEAFHAYRLQRGQPVDLDSADVPFSEGVAINEGGQVDRQLRPSPAAFNHAFLWSRAHRIDLATLGGESSSASGINDHGAVVGQATTAGGDFHAVLWR
jgi:probable HAF family extracellular repeat protein